MFIDFDDIKQRYLQLYLLAYPEQRNDSNRKAFLKKHIHNIKADLLKQAQFYAKKVNQKGGDIGQKARDIEIQSIQAFTDLMEMLK